MLLLNYLLAFLVTDKCIIPSVIALQIKSKLTVSPLIMQPIAINPSYLLIILDIATGISNEPGTLIISIFLTPDLFNSFFALPNNSFVILLL